MSFRDGLSHKFRLAGGELLNVQKVEDLDGALDKAFKAVSTSSDRVAYRKLEFFADQTAKALTEVENAKESIAQQKPSLAEAQLKQSEFHTRNRNACLLELSPSLPDADGSRKVPAAADAGNATCQMYE